MVKFLSGLIVGIPIGLLWAPAVKAAEPAPCVPVSAFEAQVRLVYPHAPLTYWTGVEYGSFVAVITLPEAHIYVFGKDGMVCGSVTVPGRES